jgi:hypothetical protein
MRPSAAPASGCLFIVSGFALPSCRQLLGIPAAFYAYFSRTDCNIWHLRISFPIAMNKFVIGNLRSPAPWGG